MDHEKLIKLATQVPPNTPFINQKIEGIIKDIQDIYRSWNITIGSEEIIHKESGSCRYEIIFKLADFLDDYIFVGRIAYYIRNRPYKFTFDTFLVNADYTPVCIKNPNTKFLTRRHILKLNSLLRFGSFSVDDIGLITFHLLWNFETNAHLAMKNKEDIEKWMKISFMTTMSTLKVNMTKLLVMTEIIDKEKYNSVVAVQGTSIRQLPKFFHDDQEKLKNIILDGIAKKVSGSKDPVQTDELPKYAYPFYQRVKIKNVNYHGRLRVGGYGAIHIVKAVMELEEQNKTIFKDKYFCVKVPRKSAENKKSEKEYVMDIAEGREKEEDDRINIERRVLTSAKDKYFPLIARYYDDESHGYQRSMLYMENYMPQNLHEFNARKDLSMGTKFSWLYQLAQVLLYFERNKIVHTNLTPSNIAVTKKLRIKVMNFADSILKDEADFKNEKRKTTMPFSSPESLSKDTKDIGYESDVFSFAHIAYELFGGKLMIGIKRSSVEKIRQKYHKKTYKLLPIGNWLNFQGPQYFMQYLYFIIMLCSPSHPACRLPPDVLANAIMKYALFAEKLF